MLLALLQATQLLVTHSLKEGPENANMTGGQAISQDVLNHVAPSGMPPHQLSLKEGAPIMLLRHMPGASGQAHGTRLVARRVHIRVIVTGCSVGSIVYIPCINPTNPDSQLPFKFSRRHFPVRLALAMTINKSQGQTLAEAGLYMPTYYFSHGHLAKSSPRMKSKKALHVVVSCGQVEGRVGVYT